MKTIKRILLDRGHGELIGNNTKFTDGRVYTLPDGRVVNEGIENSKYTLELEKEFRANGFDVVFTVSPCQPDNMSLYNRRQKANTYDNGETLLISVHNNAAKGVGTEAFTWTNTKKSGDVTEKVLQAIKDTGRHVRQYTPDKLRKEARMYVLGGTIMGMLIEYGFYDNPVDYDYLSNPDNIKKLAKATVKGVMDYNISLNVK